MNKKVLLTGATGFIGSHLVVSLLDKGYDVYALERYMTARYVLGLRKKINTFFADLRDWPALREIVHNLNPDYIIHVAAISPVAYSYDHPHEVMNANFIGTINLAEAAHRECENLKQFLFASTTETYGNGPNPKFENTEQNPNSPYSVSKVAAEKYLLYMRDAYKFPITILRPCNTYGRKDNHHFIVERIIYQMLNKQKEVELGDPDPIRDLMYVDDHVNAYLTCLGNSKAINQIFNFGTGVGTTIRNLVGMLVDITDYHGDIIWNTIPKRPLDIAVLVNSYQKAKEVLGWVPENSLKDGLIKTVKYWETKLGHT
jgi:dTDP-glucose 4,6-dehydratase